MDVLTGFQIYHKDIEIKIENINNNMLWVRGLSPDAREIVLLSILFVQFRGILLLRLMIGSRLKVKEEVCR